MPFAHFQIPASGGPIEESLNQFLSGRRVLKIEKQFLAEGTNGFWLYCVEYSQQGGGTKEKAAAVEAPARTMVDYKEKLKPEDFTRDVAPLNPGLIAGKPTGFRNGGNGACSIPPRYRSAQPRANRLESLPAYEVGGAYPFNCGEKNRGENQSPVLRCVMRLLAWREAVKLS